VVVLRDDPAAGAKSASFSFSFSGPDDGTDLKETKRCATPLLAFFYSLLRFARFRGPGLSLSGPGFPGLMTHSEFVPARRSQRFRFSANGAPAPKTLYQGAGRASRDLDCSRHIFLPCRFRSQGAFTAMC
jgi:hypothetical protein